MAGKRKGLYEFKPREPKTDIRQVETLLDLGGIDLMATESAAKKQAQEASTLVPTTEVLETIEPRKSIGQLAAINQGSQAFKNRVGFVENYLKNNKIETLDDLNILFDNLRNPEVNKMLDPNLTVEGASQGLFAPYEGAIKDMGTNLKTTIKWSNLSDKMKAKHTDTITEILSRKQVSASSAANKERGFIDYEKGLTDIMNLMNKNENMSFVKAWDELGLGSKTTRSDWRDAKIRPSGKPGKWFLYGERLREENPPLYNFWKDKIEVPEVESKGTLKEFGRTEYDYMRDFTKKDNPLMHSILFEKNEKGDYVQKDVLKRVFGKRFLRQMHLMGEDLGSTTVANLKDLVSKYEMIPKEFVNLIRRPQYIGTPRMNAEHLKIEMGRTKGEKGLIDLLVDKFDLMGYNWTKNKEGPGGTWNPISTKEKLSKSDIEKIEEINAEIEIKKQELGSLGLESVFYHPGKQQLIYFGGEFVKDVKGGTTRFVSPIDPNLLQLRKEYLAGNRKEGGYIQSSLASVDEVLNGIY